MTLNEPPAVLDANPDHPNQPPPSLLLVVRPFAHDHACWIATADSVPIATEGMRCVGPIGDIAPTQNDATFVALIAALENLKRGLYFGHAIELLVAAPFVADLIAGRRATTKHPRFVAYRDRVAELLRDLRPVSVEFLPPTLPPRAE